MSYEIVIGDMSIYNTLTPEEKKTIFGKTPFTISGGDIPAIMGVNPYETNVELYRRKKKRKRKDLNEAMERGFDYETAVKLMFKHEYKGILKQTGFKGMVRNIELPYLTGVPDDILIAVNDIKGEDNEILITADTKLVHEIKSKYLIKKEAGFNNLDENMQNYVNFIHPMYELQMQFYLYLLDLKFGVYTISIVSAPYYTSDRKTVVTSRILERDDIRINYMLNEVDDFYQRLINDREPALKQRTGGLKWVKK